MEVGDQIISSVESTKFRLELMSIKNSMTVPPMIRNSLSRHRQISDEVPHSTESGVEEKVFGQT